VAVTTSPTTTSKSTEPVRRAALRVRSARQSGYTLLELLLVLLIVTGLTATVWPRFRLASRSLTVRAAARDLVGLVARARLVALSRREPIEVRVAVDRVTITRPQPRSFVTDARARPAEEEVTVLEYPLDRVVVVDRLQVLPVDPAFAVGRGEEGLEEPASDRLSAEEVVINFYPDGTSDDALVGVSRASGEDSSSEYYVRLRGLVARADVLRTLTASDEELFSEVADATRNW